MTMAGDLIALEEQFWKGDADFSRQRLTAEALMVFPDPEAFHCPIARNDCPS
jgi:hypothetical protein